MKDLLVLVLVMLAAGAWTGIAPEVVPFATVAAGGESAIRMPTQAVARTAAEWQALWARHTAGLPERPVLPAVDFGRDMVVGVFAGEVDPGIRIAVVRVVREPDGLTVLYQLRLPRGPAPVGVPPSTPFHLVRVGRTSVPVRFVALPPRDID